MLKMSLPALNSVIAEAAMAPSFATGYKNLMLEVTSLTWN
jgi:hypothetical protein